MLTEVTGTSARRRVRGSITVEFVLVLSSSFALFAFVGEILRLSFIDQTLARVTYLGARAVATMPTDSGCEAVVKNVFQDDRVADWLFDANNDGEFAGVVAGTSGFGTGAEEVKVAITWDDDPYDGVDDGVAGSCGGPGSWLKVRSEVFVQPWFAPFRPLVPNGMPVRHESWGRANRA